MSVFNFKKFKIHHQQSFKVGTDGVLLGAWVDVEQANAILDIGSGSGLIPLILAQRTDNSKITGIEIDEFAVEESRNNIEDSPWFDRLNIVHETVQAFTEKYSFKFDLVVSNPPYFINSTKSAKPQKNLARHTDSLSFEDLIDASLKLLFLEGKLAVVLPKEEGAIFISLAESKGFYLTKLTEVRSKIDKPITRLLMEFRRLASNLTKDELIIQFDKRNDYTPEYAALTKDFYLKL